MCPAKKKLSGPRMFCCNPMTFWKPLATLKPTATTTLLDLASTWISTLTLKGTPWEATSTITSWRNPELFINRLEIIISTRFISSWKEHRRRCWRIAIWPEIIRSIATWVLITTQLFFPQRYENYQLVLEFALFSDICPIFNFV